MRKKPYFRLALLSSISAFLSLASPPTAWGFEIKEVVSPQGVKAWLVEDHNLPLITISLAWKKAPDPKNHSGRTEMMASLLSQGTKKMTARQYQRQLAASATSINFDTRHDMFYGDMRCLTKNKDLAFDLLAQALAFPLFSFDAVEKIRRQAITIVQNKQQDFRASSRQLFLRHLFGQSPYAFPIGGLIKDLTQITRDDIIKQHKHIITKSNLYVSVIGDISAEQLAPLLDKIFGDLPQGALLPKPKPLVWRKKGKIFQYKNTHPQAMIYFALAGLKRDHPDFIAYYTLNHILGGGSTSLLSQQIRQKYGLVYSIYTQSHINAQIGFLSGFAATSQRQQSQTIALIRQNLRHLRQKGIAPSVLEEAKAYLINSYGLGFDTSLAIAHNLTSIQRFDLGIDYIQKRAQLINQVTMADIERQINRFIRLEKMIMLKAKD